MDHIKSIIETLELDEIKEFKLFIDRHRKRSERKDLELFLLLREEKEFSREDLLKELYPEDHNLQAYHATRKRLIKQLNEFIYTQRIKNDSGVEVQIQGLLNLCDHLFEHQMKESAWSFWRKAEQAAEKGHQYALLNKVYQLGIQNALDQQALDLDEMLVKKARAQSLALQEENSKTANFVIRSRLQRAMTKGEELDIKAVVTDTLKQYDLKEDELTDVRTRFNIVSISRSVVLSKKDFYSFEPYVIREFEQMFGDRDYDPETLKYRVSMLYMITHVLYRNKKFAEAKKYAALWDSFIEKGGIQLKKQFSQKYALLYSNILTFSGEVEEANDVLEASLRDKLSETNSAELINTHLTRSINYFYAQDFNRSMRVFQKLHHSDTYYSKLLGREWALKKQLLEVMLQYELGNSDVVENRIKSIHRQYYDFLKQPVYERVNSFLQVVNRMNNNPLDVSTPEFAKMIDDSFVFVSKKIEDIQAMTFYCWVKSKMINQDFYRLVVALVNSE